MPVTASLIWHEAPQFSGFGSVDFGFRMARQPSDISEANVPRGIAQIGISSLITNVRSKGLNAVEEVERPERDFDSCGRAGSLRAFGDEFGVDLAGVVISGLRIRQFPL